MTKQFYSVQEVSDLLSIKVPTLRNWIKKGEIHTVKFGKLVRIPIKAFNEFVERQPYFVKKERVPNKSVEKRTLQFRMSITLEQDLLSVTVPSYALIDEDK